jgi:mono/diheme cytochrome c family protein
LLAGFVPGARPDQEPGAPLEIAFARHGQPVASLDLAALEKLARPATVRIHEPYEDRAAAFQALPFADLLDAVYGPAWRGEEELLFTCRDGYQPTVPVARAIEHRAWLAFAREGQPAFTIWKLESGARRHVELAPFYLVWENLEDPVVRQEGDYGWPYQLVGVDLIRTRERFPGMAPPPGAGPDVVAGFAAFRVHCSRCHRLNGEGGAIGPELNGAASPLALRERAWLRAWIAEPGRILPTARMEPLNPALPQRERTIDEILAYLEAMASARTGTDVP